MVPGSSTKVTDVSSSHGMFLHPIYEVMENSGERKQSRAHTGLEWFTDRNYALITTDNARTLASLALFIADQESAYIFKIEIDWKKTNPYYNRPMCNVCASVHELVTGTRWRWLAWFPIRVYATFGVLSRLGCN